MNDRVFIDTNILVYATLKDDQPKHEQAVSFITSLKGSSLFVSTQVMSELYVALLKHAIDENCIVKTLTQIAATFNVSAISLDTVSSAWKVKKKHHYSYWDSLIVASALESASTILYTEDMQHAQLIEKQIRIINPFKQAIEVK